MAAPSQTNKTDPVGAALVEGAPQARLMFARRPTVAIWFKTIKAFGLDTGGAIDTTTQERALGDYHTKSAAGLIEATDITGSVVLDPDEIPYIKSVLMGRGNEGAATLYFPNGTYVSFFAFIDKLDPQEMKEKEQPMFTITVPVTNWDPVNRVYAAPAWGTAVGT